MQGFAFKREVSASVVALMLFSGGAASAQVGTGASGARDSAVQEIIVTARKSSESILDTPIAISAMTGEDLNRRGVVSIAKMTIAITLLNEFL